jgi:hypothetical protein
MQENGWIDVSVSLHSGVVHWPDNPPVRIERALSIEHGDAANVSEIAMGLTPEPTWMVPSISFERARVSTRCRSQRPSVGRG